MPERAFAIVSPSRPQPVPDARLSVHRLTNAIGPIDGPGEILDRWRWAHFADQ